MTVTTITPLSAILTLRPSEAGLVTELPADWGQGRTTFGGLLGAIAARALHWHASEGRPMRSFSMECMAPAAPGPVKIDVDVLRIGKSVVHARATLSQDTGVCAVVFCTFGKPRPSALDMLGEAAPRDLSNHDPEQLVRLPYIEGAMPAFTQHFDYRWTATHGLFSGAKRGQLGGYVRSIDADRFDAALMIAMIDSFPPPLLTMLKVPAPASTVGWRINFTHATSKNTVQDFCRLETDTPSAGAGYATIDAKLWDGEGKLLALSRQLIVEYSA